jgi:hypothetical protein
MALSFTFSEDPERAIYADAFCSFDISLSQINECFKFRPTDTDTFKLLNDPCCCCACCTPAFCACTTYYVDGDKLGNGKVYNVAGTQILSEKNGVDLSFSNIIVKQGGYEDSRPVYEDMLFHYSKLLFGSHKASDIFTNETELVNGFKNMDTTLNSSLRNIMNSSYLEYGTIILPYTNNEQNNLNMSRKMLKTIYDFAPERLDNLKDCQLYGINAKNLDLYNIDNNTSLWLNIPLKIGDSIIFKIYYETPDNLANVLGSTPVQMDWRKQYVYDSQFINEQVYNSIDQNDDSMIDYSEWSLWQSKQLSTYGSRSYLVELKITTL